MRLLLDTNIFLEIVLEQERATEAKSLMLAEGKHEFYISDYSLHSIGLLLFRRQKHETFRLFLQDVLDNAGIGLISLFAEDMTTVTAAAQRFNLDFDDAYQVVTAEKNGLRVVSFDNDFDRTASGRLTPSQVLSER